MNISATWKRIREQRAMRAKRIASEGIFSSLGNSRGYVLIMVLLMTALLVSVSGQFIITTQTDIKYMRKFDHRLKAGTLARSGAELATFILEADKKGMAGSMIPGKNSDKSIDTWQDIWAINFPPIPFEEGTLDLVIEDENAKINLSVLATEAAGGKTDYYAIAQRFFLNMGLSMDFADIITDWVDIDDTRFAYGAETGDYYNTLTPPYNAKNAAMDSIDDLLLVKDMTPEIFYGIGAGNSGLESGLVDNNRGKTDLSEDSIEDLMEMGKSGEMSEQPKDEKNKKEEADTPVGREKSRRLSDYLRVNGDNQNFLTASNKININTASFRIISALTDKMSDDIVSEIIRRRLATPYKKVDELAELIPESTIRNNILAVQSSIFRIRSTVTYQDTKVSILAIYNRDSKKYYYWCQY